MDGSVRLSHYNQAKPNQRAIFEIRWNAHSRAPQPVPISTMSVAIDRIISPGEYLVLERVSPTRNELVNGRIYAMAGASPAHNQIAANLMGLIWRQLRASACRPYGSDQRVGAPSHSFYTYPDLSIACAPEEFDPEDPNTLVNPTMLLEILSPSTEAYDRGAKFAHYRRIPSLKEYWLVSCDRMRIERFVRRDEDWGFQEFEGPEAAVPLGLDLESSLSLSEIYARVALPEPLVPRSEGSGSPAVP